MSEKIESALSAEEWAHPYLADSSLHIGDDGALWNDANGQPENPLVAIAIANHALPPEDPRKITREKIAHLRLLCDKADEYWDEGPRCEGWQSSELEAAVAAGRALADALESYLPPEALTDAAR